MFKVVTTTNRTHNEYIKIKTLKEYYSRNTSLPLDDIYLFKTDNLCNIMSLLTHT